MYVDCTGCAETALRPHADFSEYLSTIFFVSVGFALFVMAAILVVHRLRFGTWGI